VADRGERPKCPWCDGRLVVDGYKLDSSGPHYGWRCVDCGAIASALGVKGVGDEEA
jgi:tRNA(Ile2) C34 agmatinyltransferase TiaS